MKITIGQLRRLIRESFRDEMDATPSYILGREDSFTGIGPQDSDEDYMRGYNEAQLDAGLPEAQPPSDEPRGNLNPDLLRGAYVSSAEDRAEMAKYIARLKNKKIKESANKLRKWAEGVGLQVDIDPMTGDEVVLISDTFAMKHGLPDGTDWGVERSVDDDGWIVTSSPDYGMMDFEMPSGDLSDLDDIGIGTRGY